MAYEEELAERLRELLAGDPGVGERRMFGGLAFFDEGGHMAICASGQGGLLVRVDPEESDELTSRPGVGRMVMGGREMAGWLRVDADRVGSEAELREWVGLGLDRARSLPPK